MISEETRKTISLAEQYVAEEQMDKQYIEREADYINAFTTWLSDRTSGIASSINRDLFRFLLFDRAKYEELKQLLATKYNYKESK